MRCLRAIAFALALSAPGGALAGGAFVKNDYVPHPPKPGYSYPDCFCTDTDGKRVEMGQTACLQVGAKQITARCDMSLNNPAWRQESEGCPGV